MQLELLNTFIIEIKTESDKTMRNFNPKIQILCILWRPRVMFCSSRLTDAFLRIKTKMQFSDVSTKLSVEQSELRSCWVV